MKTVTVSGISESTSMEEVFVGAIGEADPEFSKSLEIIKDECPVQSSAVAGSAGVGFILQNAFGIPAVEAPRSIGSASACGTPVVIVFQVGVSAKIFGFFLILMF